MNKDKNWRRLFTTQVDGTSITTFFNKVLDYAPTVLLVKDTHGYVLFHFIARVAPLMSAMTQVFGGYASEEWQSGIGFHGTGECFVFALKPKLAVYRWTEANDFFMIASKEFVAMGGGYRSHVCSCPLPLLTPSPACRGATRYTLMASSAGAQARSLIPSSIAD